MGIYKIPLNYTAGEFKFKELPKRKPNECLVLDYDDEYETIDYNVPIYGNEARIYTVPRQLMPNALTAVYGDDGTLGRVEFSEGGRKRLFYIWYKNITASERGVLKFVKEQADMISKEIIGKKQILSRLFVEYFYDGEAVDIAAETATAEETQAVIDYYKGDITAADNYGNFNNRIQLDNEALGVMLMCTNGNFRSKLFYKAVETFEERLKSRVLDKIGKNGDFKFISEEYD